MQNYLDELNAEQKKAVIETKGPILTIAGAGVGKTKAITYRILHLIKNGVDPSSILAITFTNKAAKEMLDRVNKLLTRDKELNRPVSEFYSSQPFSPYEISHSDTTDGLKFNNYPWIGTFHSLGVKILRENYKEAGISASFTIFDRGDSIRSIKDAMKNCGIDPKNFEPGKILSVISKEKSNMVRAQEFSENFDKSYFRKMVASIWLEYEKILMAEKGLDFDDLILKTAILLKENQSVREKYQNQWKYIHVDEYQDTNMVQYHITRMLVGKEKNIFVVGDVDQNIYQWRGANIKNILNFEKDYPEAKVITLEENYRSTKTILSVANRIIEKNKIRKPKNLFTKNTEGERVSVYTAYDENDEANFVAERSRELIKAGIKPSEIAVLYRANFQSRALEEAFMNKGLPYQVLGTKFFERKEIKDATAYIRASLNEDSFADWRRIVSAPKRGIGKVALVKIISGMTDKLSPGAKKSFNELKNLLKNIKQKIENDKFSLALKYAIETSGLIDSFKEEGGEGEERIENLKELIAFATRYDGESGIKSAEHFLTDIALNGDQDEMDEKKDAVRLMTVHASKGLEFEVVFITGLEENLFPHKKMSENEISDEESEEERRLFYVAITRAKKKVYLSYAGIRTIFGGRQVNIPSEFILEIDEEFLANEEPVVNGGKIIYLD